jgi:hypothetical protein
MNQAPSGIADAGDGVEDCLRLGTLIGLGGPVAPEVFARAAEDPDYARNLILCRNSPPLRDFLLEQAKGWAVPAVSQADDKSTLELAAHAAKSFWQWTKSGFAQVDEATYERRFAACIACPNLRPPPDRLAYKLVGADADRRRVCGLCGCVASRKARLPHETCPAPHPERPSVNRWDEPIPVSANRQ